MNAADKFVRKPMDLDEASQPAGEVHVIVERCKECSYCIEYCPADVLVYTEEINARGYHYPIVADGKSESCILCKFCDAICPEMAIYTTDPTAKEQGK